MFYTIYKITNQINGKFYIGSHKTSNLDDNYMGSGKYLKHAQEKYGMDKFTKEILFVYDTPEQMYAKEAEIVNEDFIAEENTYNIKVGGFGGWDHVNATGQNKHYGAENIFTHINKELSARKTALLKDIEYRLALGKKISDSNKKRFDRGVTPSFKGKKHSAETKQKIGENSSICQKGTGNSQYGTKWIYSLELKISKKIKQDEAIPEGWFEGRKLKFNS